MGDTSVDRRKAPTTTHINISRDRARLRVCAGIVLGLVAVVLTLPQVVSDKPSQVLFALGVVALLFALLLITDAGVVTTAEDVG